jgi:hypothetical protein
VWRSSLLDIRGIASASTERWLRNDCSGGWNRDLPLLGNELALKAAERYRLEAGC